MKTTLVSVLAALALSVFAKDASAASADPQKTRELLVVVQSNADLEKRARALQQLALVATNEAVAPLTPLLADEKLGQYARDVLELMPDAPAGDALRAQLDQLNGNALIGVVNSLGVRRDEKAVTALARLATERSPDVAGPALLALGRIGTPQAVRVVESALTNPSVDQRAAAAEACLIVADQQRRENKDAAALALYDKIRRAELPLALRVSAARGAIAASGSRAIALLIEQLHSPEEDLRDVALRAIRELRDPQVTPKLVSELDRLEPPLQALVLSAVADRGESGALAGVEQRARAGDVGVQIAALRALAKIGQASSVPILLQAASSSNAAVTDVAFASLSRIPAPETNRFVRQALPKADPALRVKLIGVLSDRKADEAREDLMTLATGADLEVSKAAFRALGVLSRPSDLPRLIQLATVVQDETVKSLADRAIVTTSMKVLQPERRADAVLTAFRQEKDPTTKSALVRPLSTIVRSMGANHEVFFALRAALKDQSPSVRAAALKALAEWPDATPTTALLELANDKRTPASEREVALSGAIRMITNVAAGRERSPLNVVEAFAQANRAVSTKAEKLMMVSGLGNLKRPEAIPMLQPYLSDPAVSAEAALAVVQIAPSLSGSKNAGDLQAMLEKIATTEKDEVVRRKAAQFSKAGTTQIAKPKGKGNAKAKGAAMGSAMSPELFNGKDLTGWDGDPAVWRVEEGVIVGGSLEGNPRNEFLATTRRYRNFVLRVDYKLVGTEGFVNGGVQFHSVRVAQPPNEMSGYQADIGAGHSGCLYDESRRKKFLARPTDELIKQLERPGDWNRYEIRCEGSKIELTLNGHKTVSFVEDDPSVAHEGLIALQIHGNSKAVIAYRNLEITELP